MNVKQLLAVGLLILLAGITDLYASNPKENRNNMENSAVVIVGYYDSNTLYTCSAREITCTSDRQTFEFGITKPQGDVWIEVYLLDSQSFGVIDKLIVSE